MKAARKVVKEIMKEDFSKLVSVTDLAEMMNISRQAVQQKLKAKELRPDFRDGHGRAYWSWKSAQSYRVQSRGKK